MPMARCAVGWNAPLRSQCRVDRVNAHTTWFFVRSVVCGVNQTQMCCNRESVSSGDGESCGSDRLSVSCLCGFDRRSAPLHGRSARPAVCDASHGSHMGVECDACGCACSTRVSLVTWRLSVSERRTDRDETKSIKLTNYRRRATVRSATTLRSVGADRDAIVSDQYALIREQQRISTLPHVMGAGAGCAGAGRLPARPAPLYGIFYAAVV